MIALYHHPPTVLHRVPAGYKLSALAVLAILLTRVQHEIALAAVLCGLVALYAFFGRSCFKRLAMLRPLWPAMLAIFIAQTLTADVNAGAVSVVRLVIMVLLADLVTMSTQMQAMMDALDPILAPLRRFGVSTNRIAFCTAYVIRLVPLLLDQWRQHSDAWHARTGKRPGWRLAAPFFATVMRSAERNAEALDARGFGLHQR